MNNIILFTILAVLLVVLVPSMYFFFRSLTLTLRKTPRTNRELLANTEAVQTFVKAVERPRMLSRLPPVTQEETHFIQNTVNRLLNRMVTGVYSVDESPTKAQVALHATMLLSVFENRIDAVLGSLGVTPYRYNVVYEVEPHGVRFFLTTTTEDTLTDFFIPKDKLEPLAKVWA